MAVESSSNKAPNVVNIIECREVKGFGESSRDDEGLSRGRRQPQLCVAHEGVA